MGLQRHGIHVASLHKWHPRAIPFSSIASRWALQTRQTPCVPGDTVTVDLVDSADSSPRETSSSPSLLQPGLPERTLVFWFRSHTKIQSPWSCVVPGTSRSMDVCFLVGVRRAAPTQHVLVQRSLHGYHPMDCTMSTPRRGTLCLSLLALRPWFGQSPCPPDLTPQFSMDLARVGSTTYITQ